MIIKSVVHQRISVGQKSFPVENNFRESTKMYDKFQIYDERIFPLKWVQKIFFQLWWHFWWSSVLIFALPFFHKNDDVLIFAPGVKHKNSITIIILTSHFHSPHAQLLFRLSFMNACWIKLENKTHKRSRGNDKLWKMNIVDSPADLCGWKK